MTLPFYIPLLFMMTTFITVLIFNRASRNSTPVLLIIMVWLCVQGIAAFMGFYTDTFAMPPRFALLVVPPLLLISFLFITKKGRKFIDSTDAAWLTWMHTVRIPVELVLLGLCIYGKVPELMTFEGRNFDIISGITAPVIAYFGFTKKVLHKRVLLTWNFICLGLLLNIVINAILSAPTPFQKFGFEQPNVGVFYFPFAWLPCCIVPLVLFSHLACIRKLIRNK
jgi:hypothetical protein